MTHLGAIRIYTVEAGTPITRDGVTHVVEDTNIVFDGGDAYVTAKVADAIAAEVDRPTQPKGTPK